MGSAPLPSLDRVLPCGLFWLFAEKMTESEIKFEQFCNAHKIKFDKIDTGQSPTPDYDIFVNSQKIVVEVKELQANDEDKKALQDIEIQKSAIWVIHRVGDKIRYKLGDAKRQLEGRAKGICPSMLVLYDDRPFPVRGIFSYEILVAMYGWETIDLHIPEKLGEPVTFGKHRFGKGKKFRKGVHTYISGLAILSESTSDLLHLDIYLNDYADKPLPYEMFLQIKDIDIYVRPQNHSNEFRKWIKVMRSSLTVGKK